MSTLDRLMERRREAESARVECCHTVATQPACLLVSTAAGESWVFPWSQLAAAQLTPSADRDELRLTFVTHEVALRGLRLWLLRDLVAALQLATVRPAPAKFSRAAADQPFVEAVTVRPNSSRTAGESAAQSSPKPDLPE